LRVWEGEERGRKAENGEGEWMEGTMTGREREKRGRRKEEGKKDILNALDACEWPLPCALPTVPFSLPAGAGGGATEVEARARERHNGRNGVFLRVDLAACLAAARGGGVCGGIGIVVSVRVREG
jgi:hypothetical protein